MMLGQHARTTMGQRWPNIVMLSGLHSLKVITARAGEDGLRDTFCSKNSIGKPRVTSDSRVLGTVVPKMCKFLSV